MGERSLGAGLLSSYRKIKQYLINLGFWALGVSSGGLVLYAVVGSPSAAVFVACMGILGLSIACWMLARSTDPGAIEPLGVDTPRSIVSLLGIGTLEWDTTTGRFHLSRQSQENFGMSQSSATREELLAMVDPDDRPQLIEAMNDCSFTGSAIDVTFRVGERSVRLRSSQIEDGASVVRAITEDVTEEQNLRKLLANVELEYEGMVENIPGAVYQMIRYPDGSRKVPYVSKSVEAIFGVTREQVYANANLLIEAIHHEDIEEKEALAQKSMRELYRFDWTGRIQRTDGEERWIHALCVPKRLDGGVIHWDGVILDVTAEKLAEREHIETKDRLAWLLRSSPVVIYACKAEAPYPLTYMSDNAHDLLGIDLSEYASDPYYWQKRIHQDDHSLNQATLENIGAGGHESIEYRFRSMDGDYRWMRDEMRLVTVDGGKEIVGTVVDITDRKVAQQGRQESEELFRAMSNASPLGLFVTDSVGAVVYANSTLTEILGSSQDALLGRGLLDRIHDEDSPRVESRIVEALRSREGTSVQCRALTDGKAQIWCSIKTAPLLDRGLVGTFEDVTERHDLELLSEQARIEAERANLAKSAYLSRISHELRTPLHAIMGFAQLLEMDELSTKQAESVRQIIGGGRHLVSLINDVLDIARAESGELHVDCAAVSLKDVVDESASLIASIAKDKAVSVEVKISDSTDTSVLADRRRLIQVVLNVLSNAIKFNRREGVVIVSCEPRSDGRLSLVVRDTGRGIPPEKAARLFTAFDRLGAEDSSIEGSGLGLLLTKRLTEAMGGSVSIDSDVRTGTVVTVTLRSAANARRARAVVPMPFHEHAADKKGMRILLIEDNEPAYRLMQGALADYDLRRVKRGTEALAVAQEFMPDLILLDVNLPDTRGTSLLEDLTREPSLGGTSIVVVSADADKRTVQRFLSAGATSFLTKPVDVPGLLAVVEQLRAEVSV